jgi:hypothetical protein
VPGLAIPREVAPAKNRATEEIPAGGRREALCDIWGRPAPQRNPPYDSWGITNMTSSADTVPTAMRAAAQRFARFSNRHGVSRQAERGADARSCVCPVRRDTEPRAGRPTPRQTLSEG